MMRRIIGFAVLSALLLAAGWALLRPSAPRPSCLVTVNVAGITNDASGTRQATFRVANAGRHKVVVAPSFVMENHSGQWRTNLVPAGAITLNTNLMGILPFHPQSKLLAARESFEVTLPLPFDDPGWRASFLYMEIRPPLNEVLHVLSRKIGVTRSRDGFLPASTDWRTR
jgi:hypothetical protein